MKNAFLVLLLLALVSVNLYSQNNMPLMQSFVGEFAESWFGEKMNAIDFNADGYDDLVLYTRKGGADQWAGVQLYLGGANMDAVPDMIRYSSILGQIRNTVMMNIGDVNGDGFDDLMTSERYAYMVNDSLALRIFYGGHNADLVPDDSINTPMVSGTPKIQPLWRLGDINGDGFDDLGIYHWVNQYSPDLAILLGGSFDIVTVTQNVSSQRYARINMVSDVNNDGFDDYIVGYGLNTSDGLLTYRYLYYGGNPLNLDNRVLLRTWGLDEWSYPGGYGAGDFNGDGYDDFVYSEGDSWRDNNKLRLGGLNIANTSEYTLNSPDYLPNLMRFEHKGIAHGDFNGDGYSDIAGADYEAITWIGTAGIWLGKANPNGLYDLRLTPPPTSPFHQFGWSLASGDFNGDGYCDLALSAPHSHNTYDPNYIGYAYIFAGNAQLADTTVANEDEILPSPQLNNLQMDLYPNPADRNQTEWNYQLKGAVPQTASECKIDIYNIRGQLVSSHPILSPNLSQGTLGLNKLSAGIYFASFVADSRKIATSKFTIK
ncbi:MAG: FG-GAP-like repeat-containing protein [Candidatus Cloacimonetes bacterium]|nr:FG-GAP-like repeat-containing protein [Candidatus Cloacimonadota bacterium]